MRPLLKARDKAILELFFSTGMRVSELASLKRDQINLKRDELSIRGKGDKLRIVFLTARSRAAINAYIDLRDDENEALFIRHDRAAPNPDAIEDANKEVGPLTPRSIERLVHHYAAQAGIPKKVSPHTFICHSRRVHISLRSVTARLRPRRYKATRTRRHSNE
jgi:site-specific recombinase XerD